MHNPRKAVSAARTLLGQTQEELASALSDTSGEHWTRGMVAKLEGGRKKFDVDILVAVAKAQGMPIEFYLYGPSNQATPGLLGSDEELFATLLLFDLVAA